MAGRKMARRLAEVARDPGGCTGVRELAEWALRAEGDGADLAELEEIVVGLADRIDAEMVELPRDKDGKPIHIDDLVWLDDVRRACVIEIDIKKGCESIICWDGMSHKLCKPSGIAHERSDSLERVVSDMTKGIDLMPCSIDDAMDMLIIYRDRIKALAEKEGGSDD